MRKAEGEGFQEDRRGKSGDSRFGGIADILKAITGPTRIIL